MFRIFIILISFVFAFNSHSVEVKGLYQFSIEVESQNKIVRQQALKKALRGVIVKVGGDANILIHDVFKNALVNANLYVTQYRYEYKKTLLMLNASFDAEKVNKLFKKANFPLWGSLRPQVLLWLITEQGLSRTIISSSVKSMLTQQINTFSRERGLPVLLPLMDLTDTVQLHVSDIWGRFEQPIREASLRYMPEAIVVMRIYNSSLPLSGTQVGNEGDSKEVFDCGLLCQQTESERSSYILDWSLITKRQKFSQQYLGISQKELLAEGLSDITKVIYQHYALSTSTKNNYVVDVVNIDSLSTYTHVFEFLSNLSAVQSVRLVSAKGTVMRFNLSLLGTEDIFLASLKLNKQLKQFIDPLAAFNQTSDDIVPIFYWEQ